MVSIDTDKPYTGAMLPANRLDCPRCLDRLAVRFYVTPRPPVFPTGRSKPVGPREAAEMRCAACGYTWWSIHPQALVMRDALR